MDVPSDQRQDVGLQEVFKTVFPIKDFRNINPGIRPVRIRNTKFDVDECQQRGLTFAAPLKVTLRLVVWDVDEFTGAKSIKILKNKVYMGICL